MLAEELFFEEEQRAIKVSFLIAIQPEIEQKDLWILDFRHDESVPYRIRWSIGKDLIAGFDSMRVMTPAATFKANFSPLR